MRAEACRVAKELADERGGKPSDYMKEAWDIVKDRYDYRPIRERVSERGAESVSAWGWALKKVGGYVARKAVEKGKSAGRSVNFTKPPKDSPKDVFGGMSKMFTKAPDKVGLPDGVKRYMKDTFRLK